ncbi:hypothetical protein [Streptomyces sp. NPDC097981]|uniref:hypothetical protein n=1 Tax=Streptomyces sp. NPDC097981 TaxID=3155428 RepID=UPI003322EFD5
MSWRTVWAQWRPTGEYWATPNLSGDANIEVHEAPDGRLLLKPWSQWPQSTGSIRPPADGSPRPPKASSPSGPYNAPVEGPVLFDPDDDDHGLHQPDTWEEPTPLGGGRVMFFEPRGVVVLERNGAAADGPTGSEAVSWSGAGPWFAGPTAAEAPWTPPARRRCSTRTGWCCWSTNSCPPR